MPGGSRLDYLGFWVVGALLVAGTVWFFRRTRGRKGVGRLVAGNALVFLSLLWAAVIAAETYLRYVYDETDQYALLMTNQDWFLRHVRLNSDQYRDVEWRPEKPPGTTRVACIGDSFTMGWGVKDFRRAWPRLVGAGLDAEFPGKYEVRNYGVAGIETNYQLDVLLPFAKSQGCDRVILGYCLNDPDDLLPRDRMFDRRDFPHVPTGERSYLADFLWFRLRQRGDKRIQGFFDWEKEAYDDPKLWGEQCRRFKEMVEFCRQKALRLDVVVFPFFHAWGESYGYDSCHDRVVEAFKRLGIDAIDLREAYRGIPASELVVNRFDAHPNELAHAIAARVVLVRAFGVR
jgi:hypothetical protein